MKEEYQKVIYKYKDRFFPLTSCPSVATKVTYLPTYDAMIYELYDDAYDYYKISPGDILTIKNLSLLNESERIYKIYFQENEYCTTPAELVPAEDVDKNDIALIKELYSRRREQKLREQKK